MLRRRVRRLPHNLPVPVSRTSSSAPQWTLVRFLQSTETSGKTHFAESLAYLATLVAADTAHMASSTRASRPFVERCADRPRPV